MMERYFKSPIEFKLQQERSHLHYQVGVTPEGVEVPRSLVDEEMQHKLKATLEENIPLFPKGPDCKWQYMWRVGPRPTNTRFKLGFPEWKDTMDCWGYKMISAIEAPSFLSYYFDLNVFLPNFIYCPTPMGTSPMGGYCMNEHVCVCVCVCVGLPGFNYLALCYLF
ncbi:hypothetical protein UlMin_012674 [Ulmus minor]